MPRAAQHLLLLTALCLPTYFLLLTSHGLTNQQEALRLIASIEMWRTGDFLAPTIQGAPYLDKPPLMYWFVLSLSLGAEPTELHLRLTVALSGLLGVLTCYAAARALLTRPTAALWSAAFLATAPLHVRGARIAEIDGLLVAPTCLGVIAMLRAWKSRSLSAQIGWQLAAALCASVLMLTKGPPGAVALLCALFLAPLIDSMPRVNRFVRARAAYARTNPILVVAICAGAFALWAFLAAQYFEADVLQTAAKEQANENLRFLDPDAARKNLEALVYGAGLGSLTGLLALAWLARKPVTAARTIGVKDRRAVHVLLAWVLGSVLVYSLFGAGSARYLAAVWPGLCILGGWGLDRMLLRAEPPHQARIRVGFIVAIVILAIAQTLWYAWFREHRNAARSPRDLVTELVTVHGVVHTDIASFEFWHGGFDAYAGRPVEPVVADGIIADYPGTPTTLDDFVRELREQDVEQVMLVRATEHADGRVPDARTVLRAAGLRVEEIPLESRFLVDQMRTDMIAVWVFAD